MKINENFLKIESSYLFSTVAKKQREYQAAHPEADVIRLSIGDREFTMTCVSMGNPHAVMFIDESVRDFNLNKYCKIAEGNTALFPDRVNAEFARIIDRSTIEMRVYERGAGETLACGTGTCATVVAAILNGYVDNEVTVHLLGGDLKIEWSGNENDSVIMTGPAAYSFTGEVEI